MVEGNELRISNVSDPSKVAGAIAGVMKEQYKQKGINAQVELKALGAGAVNQALKSIIIARGYLAPIGMDLYCIPAFGEVDISREEDSRTLVRLIVKTGI